MIMTKQRREKHNAVLKLLKNIELTNAKWVVMFQHSLLVYETTNNVNISENPSISMRSFRDHSPFPHIGFNSLESPDGGMQVRSDGPW